MNYQKETPETIAEKLREEIEAEGLNANYFIKSGQNPQQVYSVLRMGKAIRPNYRIETLLSLVNEMGLKIKFVKDEA